MTENEKTEYLLNSFFTDGIGCVNDPSLFEKIESMMNIIEFKTDDISEYCHLAQETEDLVDALEDTAQKIYDKYLSLVFRKNQLIYTSLWKGVDDDAKVWHNDYCEGADLAFLLYFHDLTEETGGALQLKNSETGYIKTIWPKKYDVVLFDQHLKWEHRVIPLITVPSDRTVMNFGFQTEKY
jgi:hypothetical protein